MVGTDAHGVNGAPAMTDRPRIGDVARHAGVSVGTVSNAFNRPDLVADATLRRIEEAVDSLNYVRNESARQLRSGQSRTIGLIVPDVANPFFTDVARGVEDVTSAAGVLVIVCNSDSGVEKEQRYLRMLAEHQVLGILHVPAGQNGAPVRGRDRRVPLVMLDHTGPARGACSVAVDDVSGGRLAVAHLLETGHRRIGFVGCVAESPSQVTDRLAGARAAMRRRRAPRDRPAARSDHLAHLRGRRRGGAGAGRHAGAAAPDGGRVRQRPVGDRDHAAGAAVRAAGARRRRHRRLRRHRASPSAAAVPLTSVRQPRNLLGRRAAELLLDETSNPRHRHTQRGVRARADRARVEPLATGAIWSLCVSSADLVTHVLDIENVGDQIGASVSRPVARRGCRRDRGGTTGGGRRPPWDRSPRCPWRAAR